MDEYFFVTTLAFVGGYFVRHLSQPLYNKDVSKTGYNPKPEGENLRPKPTPTPPKNRYVIPPKVVKVRY